MVDYAHNTGVANNNNYYNNNNSSPLVAATSLARGPLSAPDSNSSSDLGAVPILGDSSPAHNVQQATLLAAANALHARHSLRSPFAVGNVSPALTSLSPSAAANAPGSPASATVALFARSPRLGAQTTVLDPVASLAGPLLRGQLLSQLKSPTLGGSSPRLHPHQFQLQQQERSVTRGAARHVSIGGSRTHVGRGSRNTADAVELGNAFAANDEVSWRNERAGQTLSPYLAAAAMDGSTTCDIEFKRNDFIDAMDFNESDENLDTATGGEDDASATGGTDNTKFRVRHLHSCSTFADGDTDAHNDNDGSEAHSLAAAKRRILGRRSSLAKSSALSASIDSAVFSHSDSNSGSSATSPKRNTRARPLATGNSHCNDNVGDALFVDDDGTTVDLRQYSQHAARRDIDLILDDFAADMRQRLDDADASEGVYAAELASAARTKAQELSARAGWTALFKQYRMCEGDFDDARIRADAKGRVAEATSSFEIANVLQDATDMENAYAVSCESAEVEYDAEVLRDHTIRRERAIERVRAHKQLTWYLATYGEEKGKEMYESAREQRARAVKPRLTRAEMRKKLYAAEHALNNVFAEFASYIITAITVVMFMIHPNITRQFFMVLSCKSIGGIADPGASFMLGDLSEPCYSAQHVLFILVLGVPMLIFWVLGIPLFAWVILYRNRALIQAPVTGTSAILRAQKKVFEAQMAFLYRGYKPTRYYWFLVELFRKVALVGIAVFFPGALHTQLMMASLLIFVCILAQIFAKPFENRIPGAVEFLSLGTSFMIFFLANFLFVETVSHTAKVVATMFICILVIFFFVVVVIAFIVLQREEMQLAPLRRQLREAYILGHDIQQVMRKWRQDKLCEKRAHNEKKSLALAAAKERKLAGEDDVNSAAATRRRYLAAAAEAEAALEVAVADGGHVKRGRNNHDEVLLLSSGAIPGWSRTLNLVRDQAASTDDGVHGRQSVAAASLAATAAAANRVDGEGRELGACNADTAAADAIAGAEARRRRRDTTDDPTLVVTLHN